MRAPRCAIWSVQRSVPASARSLAGYRSRTRSGRKGKACNAKRAPLFRHTRRRTGQRVTAALLENSAFKFTSAVSDAVRDAPPADGLLECTPIRIPRLAARRYHISIHRRNEMSVYPLARFLLLLSFLVAAMQSISSQAVTLPPPYQDLVQVKSRQLGAVFLLPGADFRPYTKVMIDPVEVSFRKGWLKDINDQRGIAQQIAQAARSGFEKIFADTFTQRGYNVVTSPAPDVLRLSPGVMNLYLNAPDPYGQPGVRSYTVNAGEATLALVARDSTTGAVLGLVVDTRTTQSFPGMATSVSNQFDFGSLFRHWANICVKGLDTLKATPPVPAQSVKK